MKKKRKEIKLNDKYEITEAILENLAKSSNLKRSNYLILTTNTPEFNDFLEEAGWVTRLKNGENRPWYVITNKLIEKFGGEVLKIKEEIEEQ